MVSDGAGMQNRALTAQPSQSLLSYQALFTLLNAGLDCVPEKATERETGTWGRGGEPGVANTFREMAHNVQVACGLPLT